MVITKVSRGWRYFPAAIAQVWTVSPFLLKLPLHTKWCYLRKSCFLFGMACASRALSRGECESSAIHFPKRGDPGRAWQPAHLPSSPVASSWLRGSKEEGVGGVLLFWFAILLNTSHQLFLCCPDTSSSQQEWGWAAGVWMPEPQELSDHQEQKEEHLVSVHQSDDCDDT